MDDVIVIKCGGSILAELTDSFFSSIKELQDKGMKIVIVHGGGPEIAQMLNSLNIPSEFVDGLRQTTEEVLEIVEMVLAGAVNKKLVSNLAAQDMNTIGLSGIDGKLLQASPINLETLGYVGTVTDVNIDLINSLINMNYVPVIAPIGVGESGDKFNINADTAAASIATALNAKHLLFVTNVPGIMKDGSVLKNVPVSEIETLINDGTIYGGMIPKVNAAVSAISGGLSEIMIVNGKSSLISLDGSLSGTKLTKELEAV